MKDKELEEIEHVLQTIAKFRQRTEDSLQAGEGVTFTKPLLERVTDIECDMSAIRRRLAELFAHFEWLVGHIEKRTGRGHPALELIRQDIQNIWVKLNQQDRDMARLRRPLAAQSSPRRITKKKPVKKRGTRDNK